MSKDFRFMIIVLVVILLASGYGRERHRKEVEDLKEQLAHAQQFVPSKHDTVLIHDHDTIREVEVVTSPVIMAELKALRRQHLIDERTIKDLGLKIKQLDAVQTTTTETKDTAGAAYDHNLKVFSYDDRWSHLRFSLADSTFTYNIRDSLVTVVHHEYKHRFLWWRWGVKGYKVRHVNFNPHTRITYDTYIKVER